MLFSFHIARTEKQYHRKYKKLQDVAAQIGGTMKIFILVFHLILKSFVEKKYKENFVRKVLGDNFRVKEDGTSQPKKSNEGTTKLSSTNKYINSTVQGLGVF